MSVGLIYCVLNTVNGKRYIGQTTQTVAIRWKQHRADARTRMYPLHCAIRKHGQEAFIVSELAVAMSQDELNRLEVEMIAEHQSADRKHGYNVRAGGDSGGKLSAETRRKIGERHRGRVAHNKGQRMPEAQRTAMVERMKASNPRIGTHCSDETKAKIGAANRVHMLGRKQSEETRKKHSDAMFRRFATPESRALHSERLKGRVCADETRLKIALAQKGNTVPPERRARIAATVSALWTDQQYRSKQIAKRVGSKATIEVRAKLSAAQTRRWQAQKEVSVWQSL